jgi:hypothetical protein
MRRSQPIHMTNVVATVLATVPVEVPGSLGATQPRAVGESE